MPVVADIDLLTCIVSLAKRQGGRRRQWFLLRVGVHWQHPVWRTIDSHSTVAAAFADGRSPMTSPRAGVRS